MKHTLGMMALAMGIASLSLQAVAQEEVDTMEPMEEVTETEESFLLPEQAAEEGHTNSAYGLETASQARAQGAEFGRARAEQARDGGFRPDIPATEQRPGRPGQ